MKISIQQATQSGCIDALDVIKNPDHYEERAHGTAIQHVNRYKFAEKFIKNKKVIDAACGTGYGCEVLGVNNYAKYIGIDVNADAIKKAKEQYKGFANVTFFEDDITNIKNFLTSEKFDVFISFETVEHLDDYDAFLKLVFSTLENGGDFIVSTPNRDITNRGGTLSSKPKWDHHVREWNLKEFIELLESHNFQIRKIYGQSFYLTRYITKFMPSVHRFLKKKTQSMFRLFPLKLISKPNYYIIHCQK